MKKELLIKAAEELDKLLFSPSEIDFKQNPEKLTEVMMDASKELQSDDDLSEKTIDVLAKLWEDKDGKLTVEECEVFRTLGILPPADEKDEQVKDTDVIPETDELVEEVEGAERVKDLKDIAKSNDEFKEIRGKLNGFKDADDLRGAMLDILDAIPADAKPEKTPKAKEEKKAEPKSKLRIVPKDEPKDKKSTMKVEKKNTGQEEKFTRTMAISIVLKENSKLKESEGVKKADVLYMKRTGLVSNLTETRCHYRRVCQMMDIFGIE